MRSGQWPVEPESDYSDGDIVPSENQIVGDRGSCRSQWGLFTKVKAKCGTFTTQGMLLNYLCIYSLNIYDPTLCWRLCEAWQWAGIRKMAGRGKVGTQV